MPGEEPTQSHPLEKIAGRIQSFTTLEAVITVVIVIGAMKVAAQPVLPFVFASFLVAIF